MNTGMNLKSLYQNEYSFEEKINENFFKLENFSSLSIKTKRTLSTGADIVENTLYLIDNNNDDLFKDKINQIACYNTNIGWFFYEPKIGNIAYLQDELKFIYFDGIEWKNFSEPQNTINSDNQINDELFLKKFNNLSDINNTSIARNNLSVYSKNEVDEKISNIQIDSLNGEIDLSGYLKKFNNLSDINNTSIARNNLSVYSKNEVDEKISNSFNEGLNNINQDDACKKIGTLRDWEIRRVGDYKISAQKQDHDNWFICDGREINRSEYKDLFDIIGTDFGSGNGTTTFNLPDFRNKTMWGADNNINNVISSGLPNILGQVKGNMIDRTLYTDEIKSCSGCMDVNELKNANLRGTNNAVISVSTLSIDASKSNDIYGKSTIVQPPAICVNVFICVK